MKNKMLENAIATGLDLLSGDTIAVPAKDVEAVALLKNMLRLLLSGKLETVAIDDDDALNEATRMPQTHDPKLATYGAKFINGDDAVK